MDSEIAIALNDLKKSVDKQIELQDETNTCLRNLISQLQQSGQATADLTKLLQKKSPGESTPDVNAMIA